MPAVWPQGPGGPPPPLRNRLATPRSHAVTCIYWPRSLLPPGAGSLPASMPAVWAQRPVGLPPPLWACAPRGRPLTSLCCFAGSWSLVCVPSLYSIHSDLLQELARGESTALHVLRHLVALAPRSRVCWSGTPQPAREVHVVLLRARVHVHVRALVSISSSWCPCGTLSPAPTPHSRRSRSPSAPRAPVLERPHSLSSHLRAVAVLAPPQP